MADPSIKRRLLRETDLYFKKGLHIALAMESAIANTTQLTSPAIGDIPECRTPRDHAYVNNEEVGEETTWS